MTVKNTIDADIAAILVKTTACRQTMPPACGKGPAYLQYIIDAEALLADLKVYVDANVTN